MILPRFISGIVERPKFSIFTTVLAVGLLSWPVGDVRTDNSLSVWFVKDDPALVAYRDFLDTFGNDEFVLVAYQVPSGLNEAELNLQETVATAMVEVPGVARVLTASSLLGLMPEGGQEALEKFGLWGRNGTASLIVQMEVAEDIDSRRGQILESIRSILATTLEPAGRHPHMAGTGVLYEGLNQQTERDGIVFLGLAVLILVVLLRLALGSWLPVALTLAPTLAATVATTGLIGWTGHSLNLVMAILPAIVLVIGIADSIHILLAWFRSYREAPPSDRNQRRILVTGVLGRMALPCLVTSLTTALAFLVLVSSRMAVIRELGFFAAFGVVAAWALVMVAMGTGLSVFHVRPPRRALGAALENPLRRLGNVISRAPTRFVLGSLVILALLSVGILRLRVDTLTIGLLPGDHGVVSDSRWVEENLGPYTPLEFTVHSEDLSVLSPEILGGIAEWQEKAETLPGIGRTLSLVDLFSLSTGSVPATAEVAEILVSGVQSQTGDDLASFMTEDRSTARVTAFVPMGTAQTFNGHVQSLQSLGREVFPSGIELSATGYFPLYVRIIEYTVSSAVWGLLLAFLGVFVFLGVLFRSKRIFLVSIPPNLLTIAVVFGAMGWLGIPLDIATATVGAIVLGIAVDDTVHYLHVYLDARRTSDDQPAIVALVQAGPAMILTSAVLSLGLAVMMSAGSLSIVYFGFLTSLAVLAALAADLLLLPALLLSWRRQ